jgi:DNA (cytosine-5)-methyltransferase 1
MAAYYNENDPRIAAWLTELIRRGLVADGEVDTRSILDVRPDDLRGFTQCHFFAGIGGWSYALRLAGWPDDRPVWTGSCPCQPWSDANVWQGGGQGDADPRHLWPPWFWLIGERRPAVVFGEQVAAAVRRGWLDEVFGDLEGIYYACGSAEIPAGAVGADHGRPRVYWVSDAGGQGREGHQSVACIPVAAPAAFAVYGDVFTRARRALDGDFSDLRPCDGLSVVMERDALRGYGNAIVPAAAAEFIAAYLEAEASTVTR